MASSPGRFLLCAGLTAGIVVAVFWVLSVTLPMGFMPQEYAMWRTRQDLIHACRLAPTVIQGDSRAAAGFLPSHLGGAVNVAFGGASPVETYYAAREILACDAKPRRVVLSISPGLFMRSSFFWDRSVLFGFLDFSQLEEVRKASRRMNDAAFYGAPKVGDWEAMLENGLRAARFPSFYISYITNHLVMGRWAENRAAAMQTLASQGQHGYGTAAGSSALAEETEIRSFVPSPLLNAYMERMLESYAASGVRVDFVAVPMNEATLAHIQPALARGFDTYLRDLASRHANFHVLGPAVRGMQNAYFGDSTHLNTLGAERFSDDAKTWLAADPISRDQRRP